MVYDNAIISLYLKGCPLAKMYVLLDKRDTRVIVKLNQNKFSKGLLFLYSNETFYLMHINKPTDQFELGELNLYSDFVVAFYSNDVFIGRKGKIKNENEILEKFNHKFESIKKEERENEKKKEDLNFITDQICVKLFSHLSLGFYNETKIEFEKLIRNKSRVLELEKVIPNSIFVRVIENENAVIGVVSKNNNPSLLAVGFKGGIEKLTSENQYQFISSGKEGYFLSFRRTSDGDKCLFL